MELSDALNSLNISLEKSAASGYLSTPAVTTTTLADTYYAINGTFVNNVLDNFELGTGAIVYKGTKTREFKALLNVSCQSDTATTIVTITVTKNGNVQSGYEVSRLLKLTTDVGSWMVPVDFELSENDEVSLQVKSDKTGAEITFHSCISNLFPTTHIIE